MSTFAQVQPGAGDMVLPRVLVTDSLQVILYTVTQGLLLWQSEWFLDTTEGFPWTVILGQKVVNTAQFVAVMKAYLLSCTGIVTADVTASFNGPRRSFAYEFSATTSIGAVLVGGTNTPFQYLGPN